MDLKNIIKLDQTFFSDYIDEEFERNFQEYILEKIILKDNLKSFFSILFNLKENQVLIGKAGEVFFSKKNPVAVGLIENKRGFKLNVLLNTSEVDGPPIPFSKAKMSVLLAKFLNTQVIFLRPEGLARIDDQHYLALPTGEIKKIILDDDLLDDNETGIHKILD